MRGIIALCFALLLVGTLFISTQERPNSPSQLFAPEQSRPVGGAGLRGAEEVPFPVGEVRSFDEIGVGAYPYGVVYDSTVNEIYVSDFYSNAVSIISGMNNTVIGNVHMPYGVGMLACDKSNGNVYLGDAVSTVYVISGRTNQLIDSVNLGLSGLAPEPEAYNSETGAIYVISSLSNTVTVLNGQSDQVTSVIPVGNNQYPNGAVFDPTSDALYVSEEGSNSLTVIGGQTNQVTTTVANVPPGRGVAYVPISNSIYVAANTGKPNATVVTIINASTNSITGSVPLAHAYWGAAYDPVNRDVYVTGRDSANVTIINTTSGRVVGFVPTQNGSQQESGPIGIAYDSRNQEMYVALSGTNNVTVLPQFFSVAIQEVGLPSDTPWSFSFNGTTEYPTVSAMSWVEPNGSYSLRINPVPGYVSSFFLRSVTVSGQPQTIVVAFHKPGEGSSIGSEFQGLLGSDWYYLSAAGIVVGVAVYVFVVRRGSIRRRRTNSRVSSSALPRETCPHSW